MLAASDGWAKQKKKKPLKRSKVQKAFPLLADTKIAGQGSCCKPSLSLFYYPKTVYLLLKPFTVKGFGHSGA